MLAMRRRIRPRSSNSQFSLPYERNQLPLVIVPLIGEAHLYPIVLAVTREILPNVIRAHLRLRGFDTGRYGDIEQSV